MFRTGEALLVVEELSIAGEENNLKSGASQIANFWEIRDWEFFLKTLVRNFQERRWEKTTTSALRPESYYHHKEEGEEEINNQYGIKNKQAHAQQIAREISMGKGQKQWKKLFNIFLLN